jgi:hypothetical protein
MKISKMMIFFVAITLISCRTTKTKSKEKIQIDSVAKSEIKIEKNIFNVSTDSGYVITEEIIEYKSDSITKIPAIVKRSIKSFHKYNVKRTLQSNEKVLDISNVQVKKKIVLNEAKKEPIASNKKWILYVIPIILILFFLIFFIYKKN